MPGDALWPVQKVVNPERAESVETKLVVESRFEEVRTALETGDTDTAASLLQTIGASKRPTSKAGRTARRLTKCRSITCSLGNGAACDD